MVCEQCTFTATDEFVGGLKQARTIRLSAAAAAAAVETAYIVLLSHTKRRSCDKDEQDVTTRVNRCLAVDTPK